MPTPPQSKLSLKSFLRLLIILSVIFTLAACNGVGGARRLRDAQDAFNDGARLENRLRYESAFKQYGLSVKSQNDISVPSVDRPEQHYAAALEILKSIREPEEHELKNDKLLGTKLTLQALCQWKLGQGTEAISLAETALANLGAESEPRDWVIARALPALVINDEAYAKIPDSFTSKNEDQFAAVEQRLLTADNSAIFYINEAGKRAQDRPIEIWLLQVELSVYANWLKARSNLLGEREIPPDENLLLKDKCKRLEKISLDYADEDQKKPPKTWPMAGV
jgi:tetratricopeptide (TPR) repeat protein